jgi:Putative beta-barrel porin 2
VPRPPERPEAESHAHEGRLTLRGDILPLLTGELAVGYRNQTSPNAAPGGTRYSGLTWRGALQRRLSPDASVGLFLTRATPVSAYEENGFYVSTALQGTLVAPLPLAFQLDGALGYRWNDYRTVAAEIGVPREDRMLSWSVGLRRPIHHRLYLSGMYRAENRRSNVGQFDVDTSGFYVQLEWNPLGPPAR